MAGVADAPSAPSVPTSPCPPFGKAKRAVIRLPTSVHDDRICCSTSPHWGVQDPPDCALVRRSGASVRRWSRNRNLRPAIAQLRHLPISRAWPTFPRLDPQRPHLLDASANLRLPPHGHQGRPPAPARRRRSARPDLLEVNDLGRNMWTDDGLAIIIEGKCEDWPGGPRTLTPRASGREPNGRTLWYGAELNPDGRQVWSGSRRRPSVGCGRRRPSPAASASSTPSSPG